MWNLGSWGQRSKVTGSRCKNMGFWVITCWLWHACTCMYSQKLLLCYTLANEVARVIYVFRSPLCPYVHRYVRLLVCKSVHLSHLGTVDISRTVRQFYIKLGMRVYPGGIILCVVFRVMESKVTESYCYYMYLTLWVWDTGGLCTKSMGI